MTPEQFYSESKWPEMKDKFDKSAFKFSHDDLCQFANDYAQHYRDVIKLTTADKERIEKEADVEALLQYDYASAYGGYIAGATFENERAQQELQAYRDIIKELLPIAEYNHEQNVKYFGSEKWPSTRTGSLISRARKLIDTV